MLPYSRKLRELQAAGHEEDGDHQHPQRAGARALRCEQFLEKPHRTDLAEPPDNPAAEKHERHRQRQVHVGVGAPEQRLFELKAFRGLVAPAD